MIKLEERKTVRSICPKLYNLSGNFEKILIICDAVHLCQSKQDSIICDWERHTKLEDTNKVTIRI